MIRACVGIALLAVLAFSLVLFAIDIGKHTGTGYEPLAWFVGSSVLVGTAIAMKGRDNG